MQENLLKPELTEISVSCRTFVFCRSLLRWLLAFGGSNLKLDEDCGLHVIHVLDKDLKFSVLKSCL